MAKIRKLVCSYAKQDYGGIPRLLSIKGINALNGNKSWYEVRQEV
jgi:hypothetical protein